MASFEDLKIGFKDNGYNTVDSFVDRCKELPAKNVSIYEIDFNPLNDAHDSEEDKIENAEKIHEQGMIYSPLNVYRNKSHRHNGEKKYMLLGGHFRLDALLRNAELYPDAQKMVPVVVLPEPENETKELEMILLLNEVRPLSDEDIKRKVKMYLKVWNGKAEAGEKPKGIQKRKWIAQRIGIRIGEKAVEKIIHEIEGYQRVRKDPDEIEKDEIEQLVVDANMTEPVIGDTESSADKEDRKRIVKNLKETMGRSVKIEKGWLCFQFSDKSKNTDDFYSILNILGFDDNGEMK